MSIVFSGLLIAIFFMPSCTDEKEKATLIIKDQMVDTSFGLAAYNVYCSDTSWTQMMAFGDSLKQIYSKKVYTIVAFVYPENAVPIFKENSYAITKTSTDDYFIIGRYYYTDTSQGPYLEKLPEFFKKAKEREAQ